VKQRVLTALVLIPPVLAALFLSSPWPILVLAFLASTLGTLEIKRMLQDSSSVPALGTFAIIAPALALAERSDDRHAGIAALAAILFLFGVAAAYLTSRARQGRAIGALVAQLWVAGPMLSLLALHAAGRGPGIWSFATPVLLAIVPLWGGDTAAILAGKAFGKHPLAPKISPKKTWEGAIANLAASILVAVLLASAIGYQWPTGLACGIAAGVLGQAGDLFESYVKRKADLKDSGTLLPGHGGIMDRVDSILFTAPAVALILLM